MINMEAVALEVQNVLAMLDADEMPDTFDYLSSLLAEDDTVSTAPYEIANVVLTLDKPREFPGFLLDFIVEMFELEIAEGNEKAMNDLGAQYYDGGRGFEQSFPKAMDYYIMAAEHGSRKALENLGYCYYYGRGGRPDYEKAFHCFAPGAFQGQLISLYKVGDMYLNGLYVPQNERTAFLIFQRCLETMTQEAAEYVAGPVFLRLGRMYLAGLGTEQDLRSALICFQKAEAFLFDMVHNGDVKYRRSLDAAIAGQAEARRKLAMELPARNWGF